ncbi:MAG TPA: FHA domain-containing protein [Candidatus Methylacidiphilales bacterium]|jgi:hypothetical protein|nr:FHA domain-containing protein [Candidatus Methylacidiphilales bacterium]
MTVTDNQLFSVEDALARLAQNREQGLLIAARAAETIQIYVQDGFVVRAQGNAREGPDAVGQALSWKDSSFTWLRGIQPPNPAKNLHVSLIELIAKFGAASKPKTIATGKLNSALKRDVKEPETKFRYFLVPQDRLMERVYINKTSTVMGRDPECDFFVDNVDVSWRHCLLDLQARGMSVLDLNSTNGTFVNGILVRDAPLKPGDRLELGPCAFAINREALEALP